MASLDHLGRIFHVFFALLAQVAISGVPWVQVGIAALVGVLVWRFPRRGSAARTHLPVLLACPPLLWLMILVLGHAIHFYGAPEGGSTPGVFALIVAFLLGIGGLVAVASPARSAGGRTFVILYTLANVALAFWALALVGNLLLGA
jgi:hypothetical protein